MTHTPRPTEEAERLVQAYFFKTTGWLNSTSKESLAACKKAEADLKSYIATLEARCAPEEFVKLVKEYDDANRQRTSWAKIRPLNLDAYNQAVDAAQAARTRVLFAIAAVVGERDKLRARCDELVEALSEMLRHCDIGHTPDPKYGSSAWEIAVDRAIAIVTAATEKHDG